MTVFATIGATAAYLLFVWLLSAAGAAWIAERKGYGERLGLSFGLILTFVGFLIVLLLPSRPGSTWKREGALPNRRRPGAPVSGFVGSEGPARSEGSPGSPESPDGNASRGVDGPATGDPPPPSATA